MAMLTTTAFGIGRNWNKWVELDAYGMPAISEVTGTTTPICPPEGCARWYNVWRGADYAWYSNGYK